MPRPPPPRPPATRAPSPRRAARRRLATVVVLLACAMLASAAAAAWWMHGRVLERDGRRLSTQLELRAQALQRMVDRYRVLPTVLALDPQLRAALTAAPGSADTDALNRKLEHANGATRTSTLTLIDHRGIAIAANNWREASSNVDIDYGFRPYFQQAMRTGVGTFYAVGVSTHVPGYFIAEAVRDDAGRPIGAVVVKITLDALEREWADAPEQLLLSDAHDVVFLTNRAAWRYRTLHVLDADERAAIAATRQYPQARLRAARIESLETLPDGTRRVRIAEPATRGTWLLRSLRLPGQAWTLHALQDARAAGAAARTAFAATLAAWLPLVLLVLFLRQRARLARHQQRSREELERMVQHHAQALRSAQDDLVLAAHAAARGQLASLEHLPQGVSVVDAQLRLLAWNSRYQAIFQYPPDLLQVGRPIEDLLRHNARRGWLGEDAEEAVQRRLDYLRSGGAYQQERERPDGTVLEIRGNPLPGGGFVTSYTDITSYTAAARELRTLASTLQRRVDESTRDLREAKLEAERANRYKGRFVAAAVHDLLQPLNAARMLAGALRERLHGAQDIDIADRIAQSLDAQDSLLSDLLELSRLDTGALQPQPADVALGPLLDGLAAQCAVLAQARGLSLRRVPTDAVVRTDPALLRRLLQNLLANALQYTRSGGIVLGCRRDGECVRIEVHDTGAGIPAAQHAAIFEEFRRLDNGVERDRRNAGLGLSIVQRIARLLGHRLALRSWPGRGSVFSVRVPRVAMAANAPVHADTPAPVGSPLQGRRVWVVDDDRDGAAAMRILLEGWGCTVATAHDAAALRALCQAQPAPDLLLLDYQLGDVAGPDLLPDCRRHWDALPPVVVVSALRDDPQLRARIEAAGLHLLPKPVAPAALRALLSHLLLAARSEG